MKQLISLCATLALTFSSFAVKAADVDLPVPARGGVVSTAPIARSEPAGTPASVSTAGSRLAALVHGKDDLTSQNVVSEAKQDLTWLLTSAQLPWPLRYRELSSPGVLYLPLPAPAELRLMLPGVGLEEARRTRQGVAKYVTDLIGLAAQDRARQLEGFNAWAAQVQTQKNTLSSSDEWAQHAFSALVGASLAAYKNELAPQSEMQARTLSNGLPKFVSDITELMNAAQGYEQRAAWYQVLTQLQEGLQLYQLQMQERDAQLFQAIAAFEVNNPPVARPEGDAPVRDPATGARAMPKVATMPLAIASAPAARVAAEPPVAEQAPETHFAGYLIAAAALIVTVVGGASVVRRNRSKQVPSA